MTRSVVTVDASASVFDACILYKERKVGCLVVVQNDSCAGIVTERDLIERAVCQRLDLDSTMVHQIMSRDVKVVNALDTVEKALETMKQYKIKKLPVISGKQVVGIITMTDIAEARPDLSQRFMESWVKQQWRD